MAGRVIPITGNSRHALDDPVNRAEFSFAEALRNVKAAREAIGQVDDPAEKARLRTGYLTIANEAIEGTADE